MNLLEKLNWLMKENNIKNIAQLSKEADIPYTTLKSILDGDVNDVRLSTSRKLCDFFKITLDDLLDNSIELKHNKDDDFRYASYGGEDEELDEEDEKKIRAFVEFLKTQKKQKDKED